MRRWVAVILTCIFIALPMPAYAMQIFVKTIEGRTFVLDVEPTDSIEGLKAKIYNFQGIPINEQFMYFGDILLEDGNSLVDYNIQKMSFIFLRQDPAIAAAEAARVAAAKAVAEADAAKKAKEQRELTELLSVIPSIAGLALNIGDLTNSLLTTKCAKGKTVKNVKKGAKCPKGYVKKK
jgi:hypothetical protein